MINTNRVYLNRNRQKSHRTTYDKPTPIPPHMMISARKNPACGEERDEGKGAGWVLASVKLLGGDRDRLILLGEMRVLFPEDKMKFSLLTGLARFMGSPL